MGADLACSRRSEDARARVANGGVACALRLKEVACTNAQLLSVCPWCRHVSRPLLHADSHAVLLTFNDAGMEKVYMEWSALTMHKLDLAALLILLVNLATLGFSPSFAWAARHPLWWTAGFLSTVPLLLALPPATRPWCAALLSTPAGTPSLSSPSALPCTAILIGIGSPPSFPCCNWYCYRYRRHRQLSLAACLITAAAWQTATGNCTLLMGGSHFFKRVHWDAPTACFAWHITNLLTFQLRWCFMVPLSFLLYAVNALYLLPALCADWAPAAVDNCVLTSTLRSAGSIFLALLVLRLIELHTRRLFVRSLEQPHTD